MSKPVVIGDCTLYLGDSRIVLKSLATGSVDAVVCDPPYEIDFMGKGWDRSGIAYDIAFWREVLRVLKPGGHLLAASHSRTYHRMTCAIEDAGFEIRDMVDWVYGSGFPKSHNLDGDWEGWGTALKPAKEPFALARKPLVGTVAGNIALHGVGAIHIDACRIVADDNPSAWETARGMGFSGGTDNGKCGRVENEAGRWPANIIHDGSPEVVAAFPSVKGGGSVTGLEPSAVTAGIYGDFNGRKPFRGFNDSGSSARFFYCAKASIEDREHGLAMFEHTLPAAASFRPNHMDKALDGEEGSPYGRFAKRKNIHPTVKPTELMRYLVRLITPPGGVVLDPFMGSGSTGRACRHEFFKFIGIEMEAAYFEIAQARIAAVVPQVNLFAGVL